VSQLTAQGVSAEASASVLADQAMKNAASTQPCRPLAYSLTIRQEGSNSGLKT
jgi:hypothetical protein